MQHQPAVNFSNGSDGGGGRTVTAPAHQQYPMVVEAEQSQHLLTSSTHRGLHHCTPLPFGMALVFALFQKAMEQILQGTGDTVDLDDLQVTGA